MRFVPIKAVTQQDFQARHRVRGRLVKARTALSNEIRGLLSEYGIILPQGVTKFHHGLLPRRPSRAIAAGAVSPRNSIATTHMRDRVACLMGSSS
jgi:transposase